MLKKVKKLFKKVMIYQLTPIKTVLCISAIAIIYFYFNKRVIATSLPLSLYGYKFLSLFGFDITNYVSDPDLVASMQMSLFDNPLAMLILGFGFGSVIANLLRNEFKVEWISSKQNALFMIVGGFCVGFGVQGIQGANIGEVFGAISMMSLSSWFGIPFICLGLYFGKILLKKLVVKKAQ